MTRKQLYVLLSLLLVFGIVYSLIGIVNHLLFRTYSLDLGLYTHALYQYSHLKMAGSTMIKDFFEPMPGSHFDLHLVLFSPLVYLLGTYTLLIVQILAILAGGIGVWKYLNTRYPEQPWISMGGMVCFYSFFGVFSAVMVNYHSVVVAASTLPWFLFAIENKRTRLAVALWLFMLIAQENISLWLIFVALSLMIMYRKEKPLRNLLLFLMVFSALYFIVVVWVIIPFFSMEERYTGLNYAILGTNLSDVMLNLIGHPVRTLRLLFVNHSGDPSANGVKAEFYIFLTISGFWMLYRKPVFILMLLPLFFQKMLHDNFWIWSVGGQYSIEFAPVIAVGTMSAIAEMKPERLKKILVIVLVFSNILISFRLMDHTVVHFNKSHIRFYSSKHYSRDYDVREVRQQLQMIPSNTKVSAQSPFVPHLVLRDDIFQFPLIKDAEYVVVSEHESPWPLNDAEFMALVQHLSKDKQWEIFSHSNGVTIYRRTDSILTNLRER